MERIIEKKAQTTEKETGRKTPDKDNTSLLRGGFSREISVLGDELETKLSNYVINELDDGRCRIKLHNFFEGNFESNELELLAVLCPLYAPGTLEESELLKPPLSLGDSRVGSKFKIYVETAKIIKDFTITAGMNLSFKFLFANTGVLLSRKPTEEDDARLDAHMEFYKSEAERNLADAGIKFTMDSFSDLRGLPIAKIPKYIITSRSKNEMPRPKHLIKEISREMESLGINPSFASKASTNSIVGEMLSMKGASVETVKGLVETYIASELSFIPILNGNGIFINAERFQPLLRMPDMLSELKQLKRVDVLI